MLRVNGISRRDIFRIGGAAALVGYAQPGAGAPGEAVEWAQGTVFEDRSGLGRRQDGDPGIADVLVSNGLDVTRTDRDGRYQLRIYNGSTIFVIKPSGWSVPVDPVTRLPRNYYRHSPHGTPVSLKYAGVDATGALPENIDFPLRRAEEHTGFSVLMFADPQPADRRELDYIRETVISTVEGDYAFGLTLGDVMSDDLSLYGFYNRLVGQVGIPFWNLPGNHDLNLDAPHPAFARETWKQVFGPTCQAFEYGQALFVMLDNVEPLPKSVNGYSYRGRIGEQQLTFVRNLLAQVPTDRLVVFAMHIPLASALNPDDPSSNTIDAQQLLDLVGDRPSVSFSGHMHTTEHHYLGAAFGRPDADPHHHHVLTALSGSWWSGPPDARGLPLAQSCDGTPNGYHVLEIEGTKYTTRFVPTRERAQMRIMLHRSADAASKGNPCLLTGLPVAGCDLAATNVLVNVFDGGPRTLVNWDIDGEPVSAMQRILRSDPLTEDLFERAGSTRKPWVKAEPSSHIWQGSLPSDLGVGLHRLTVHVTDGYGRSHLSRLVFEVLPA